MTPTTVEPTGGAFKARPCLDGFLRDRDDVGHYPEPPLADWEKELIEG